MILLPYKLNSASSSGRQDQATLSAFSGHLLEQAARGLSHDLLNLRCEEAGDSWNPLHGVLLFGVLWRDYGAWAQKINPADLHLTAEVCRLRDAAPEMKDTLDQSRANAYTEFLVHCPAKIAKLPSLTAPNLERFLLFLEALGDYSRTVDLLRCFLLELSKGGSLFLQRSLLEAVAFANWFSKAAETALGLITRTCDAYICQRMEAPRQDADQIQRLHSATEIQLNLVLAELIQSANLPSFEQAARTIVLAPRCLCEKDADNCLATEDAGSYTCSHCSARCSVAAVERLCDEYGAELVLIEHNSSFAAWIDDSSRVEDAGIIGIACAANLIEGGLEAARRGIPATCIALDHPGCTHWFEKREGSQFNLTALEELLHSKQMVNYQTDLVSPL
ncbi:DUF116 domain-containing protein [bacterium]|nr:DUF116 domain-containing protein [bacterium]